MSRTLAPIKHGTYGGAQAHRKRGEHVCDACLVAQATYQRDWRHSIDRDTRTPVDKARDAARRELAARHQREYQQLLNFYKNQMARLEEP